MKIVSSASARPNFVKLAAVHHALVEAGHDHLIVHTGQHYDPLLSDIFFTQLQIPDPAYNLGVKGGDRETVLRETEKAMLTVLKNAKPDLVLVYGDVNGALGAARAAVKAGCRLGHIEAGLRSFDPSMPEEVNRIEIDQLSDELFVTEESAEKNLKKENVKGNIHFVGNTMIDTLVRMRPIIGRLILPIDTPKNFGIVTLHRPSNVDTPEALAQNLRFLSEVSTQMPILLPLHHRTRESLKKFSLESSVPPSIRVIEPLGYIEFLSLLSRASFILTDSGGIQEEATFLGKRCFTLRRNTERPSTVNSGSNVLIDPSSEADRKLVLDFAAKPKKISVKIPKYWDGKAGERIVKAISN